MSIKSVLLIGLCLLAIPLGSGTYTFIYADGLSYLSNDPKACANCHVMQETFDDWQRSSHAHAATCNDCHVPHNFIGKWYTKAENGMSHSIAMTLGHFENIRARPVSKEITLDNCVRCHNSLVDHVPPSNGERLDCTSCHRNIGHPHR